MLVRILICAVVAVVVVLGVQTFDSKLRKRGRGREQSTEQVESGSDRSRETVD